MVEDLIEQYLNDFFIDSEKALVEKACPKDRSTHETQKWEDTELRFKQLLPYTKGLDDFHIRIAETCSFFIESLFQNNITDDTFVISIAEHTTIEKCLSKTMNKLVLHYNTIESFDIDFILNQYKQSNCKRILLYLTGIVEMHILPLEFCHKLKDKLIDSKIPHTFILDDVQSMFLVPRDYSIFDYILFTCHSLLPNFDTGILLSKKGSDLGYQSSAILNEYLNGLELVLKLNELNRFNFLLQQYYAEELGYNNFFDIPKNCLQSNFYLYLKDSTICNVLNKYTEKLETYGIILSGNTIIIRGINFILQTPAKALEGLNILKQALQKSIKLKTIAG